MEFTNSSLVSYVRISKFSTNPRNKPIKRISVHCMAGNLSVETCGDVFCRQGRNASSNYGIGTDGRIALYLEEQNRSWCTSSKDNDHQAVTIEVANNKGAASGWPVSDKAWNSLIALCTDICRRNGKTRITWLGDKNKTLAYKQADDEMVITVHRWFAAKACPGDYLYGKMADLMKLVNMNLQEKVEEAPEVDEIPAIVAETNEQYLWKQLSTIITNDYGKAGVMGNLFAESGLVSANLQNAYEKKLSMTDESYTAAVDNGSYKHFKDDGAGYGLAQWTYWSRKEGLLKYVKSVHASVGDFRVQVDYLIKELKTSFKPLVTKLNSAKSVAEASKYVLHDFERPKTVIDGTARNATAAAKKKLAEVETSRCNYSTHFYNMYAEKYKIPYTVRVTASSLRIRKEASNKAAQVGSIKSRGICTIVEEKAGPGSNKGWGKLDTGKGWISLDYTEKT